jgi:hypothetical protein
VLIAVPSAYSAGPFISNLLPKGMPHTPRAAVGGFICDIHALCLQMGPHGCGSKGAGGEADMIDIPPAGMGDIPQDDQRRPTPKLLHPKGLIRIARHAAQHRLVKADGPSHVIDQNGNVIQAHKAE